LEVLLVKGEKKKKGMKAEARGKSKGKGEEKKKRKERKENGRPSIHILARTLLRHAPPHRRLVL